MNERTVRVQVRELCGKLDMKLLCGNGDVVEFSTPEINRPGLQFTGYYERFYEKRVQLIGNAEMQYLFGLDEDELMERMDRFMGFGVPCVVCARGMTPPDALIDRAKAHGVPVFISHRKTGEIGQALSDFLEMEMAPRILMHGVLLDVFGIGVLLTGESSIGKSETALELIKAGHRLAADDVVEVFRASDLVIGRAPEATRHLMEVRGIGIVDVRYLFGMGAVISQKEIDMVVQMELWNENTEYDRVSMGSSSQDILGIEVPLTVLPVSPGRNIAVIIEVAARNRRLQRMGYDTSAEFHKRMTEFSVDTDTKSEG